jgi:hypothetical protein
MGSGRNNSETITVFLDQAGETNGAAQLRPACNGFNDWFIPSKDELNALYKYKKEKEPAAFSNERYLSSTQDGRSNVWSQNFKDGRQLTMRKNLVYRVRCIRVF